MDSHLTLTVIAALLVWQVLLLAPMIPGKLIDTRDFSVLPKWQFNVFNAFLTSLSLASLIIAICSLLGYSWVYIPALILAIFFILVFLADLFEVFPVVKDKIPVQLLILESLSLGSAGVLAVIILQALI